MTSAPPRTASPATAGSIDATPPSGGELGLVVGGAVGPGTDGAGAGVSGASVGGESVGPLEGWGDGASDGLTVEGGVSVGRAEWPGFGGVGGFGVTAGTTVVVKFAQRYSRGVRPDPWMFAASPRPTYRKCHGSKS